jgi:ABC-type transport system substrate-binding protein
LIEVDLLRAGEPMPVVGPPVVSDYRMLVSRGSRRPRAQLYAWSLRQTIPTVILPLLKGDYEPTVDLGAVLHALYDRARFDLRLDYTQPPVPTFTAEDVAWALVASPL